MRCTKCKEKMKCVDTREQDNGGTKRKWVCDACSLQGYSYEFISGKLIPRKRNKQVVDVATDRLMKQIGIDKPVPAPAPTKKHKEVVRKQRARESADPSVFEDMDEDYAPDLGDLGVDIPRNDDW
jgi:transcriptional regulator NrdR family protein